jgi:hypothetical protein
VSNFLDVPSYEITNIIRSHRVGKPDEQVAAVAKDRQIIVRLSDPGVKFRILKCGKNLKAILLQSIDFIFELAILFFEIVYFCYQWGSLFINNFDNVF